MQSHSQPPRVGRFLLRLRRLGARRDEVETDLLELFAIREEHRGRGFASRRYVADALSLWTWRPAAAIPTHRERYGGFRAMKQDLVFAVRLFRRQPGLFGLTIAGLRRQDRRLERCRQPWILEKPTGQRPRDPRAHDLARRLSFDRDWRRRQAARQPVLRVESACILDDGRHARGDVDGKVTCQPGRDSGEAAGIEQPARCGRC